MVDQEIKTAVTEILGDPNTERSLKNVAISDFRKVATDEQEASTSHLDDSVLQGYNTRSRAKKPAAIEDENFVEIDGVILEGMEKSVGSTIKTEATFSNLSEEGKYSVYLSLNSIIDLSNNSTAPGTQRSFFSGLAWQQLKNLVYESRTMPQPPENVEDDLREIEQMADSNLKNSYQLCLRLQAKHAFTPEEHYFEIYAHISKNATEQDFVNEAWTPIMAALFNDEKLVLKWGDSVPLITALSKRRSLPEENVLGDRVDLRVMTSFNGGVYDVMAAEFANSKLGPSKFTSDHLKILRKSKIILDPIVDQEFTTAHDARRVILPCFQANGLDSEIKIMKLFVPGLYTIQHIGSIDISDSINFLRDLRKKTIPRLEFI
ncbi:MAG: hypothetical protein EXX96DRAFT_540259 [Benjaminiella poitrasii]|nr:MAG: hypothetical protein EXX96DRAFT_540259 [Benjaminiella poitrasii]